MSLMIAWKAFLKAWKQPQKAREFLQEGPPQTADATHLSMLYHLQATGRLVDFLKEDLSSYSDAQVGAAARAIHQDCARAMEDLVCVRPLLDVEEGQEFHLEAGYDAISYKITGKLKGEPPYTGVVRHRGWKAHKLSLPKSFAPPQKEVVCPAEIEVL